MMNTRTATGTVHAAIIEPDGRPRPACAGAAVHAMHYAAPTDAPITCRRCIGSTPSTADIGDKKARAAERRAADKRRKLDARADAPARAAAAHAREVEFLAGVVADTDRTPEQRRAAAADLAERVARFAEIVADAEAALAELAKG